MVEVRHCFVAESHVIKMKNKDYSDYLNRKLCRSVPAQQCNAKHIYSEANAVQIEGLILNWPGIIYTSEKRNQHDVGLIYEINTKCKINCIRNLEEQ